mmetsp:Transcript_55321/g.157185  ORF Transcript_55321/g.157185 Transcript_55321/m.157185 type:complete len:174 (-) Transcript_55321:105-626(-)
MSAMTASIDGSFMAHCSEFKSLLLQPRLEAGMFKCQQSDWTAHYQSWCIVYAFASVLVSLLFLVLRVLAELAGLALATVFFDIVQSAVYIVLAIVLAYSGWFCVVKRQGCCGKAGYVAWAAVYIILNCGPLLRGGFGLIYLAMLVPVAYMVIALVKLATAGSSARTAPLVRIS